MEGVETKNGALEGCKSVFTIRIKVKSRILIRSEVKSSIRIRIIQVMWIRNPAVGE
jgi:hypothetical protein